jgi:uncharacterized protein (DUF952 family)
MTEPESCIRQGHYDWRLRKRHAQRGIAREIQRNHRVTGHRPEPTEPDTDRVAAVLHITTDAGWRAAVAAGSYRPASHDREGFIHCSTYDQAAATATKYFAGHTDLVLLCIDEARVAAPIRYEPPPSPAPPGPNGSFRVSPGLP